jgi:hypothetical protein
VESQQLQELFQTFNVRYFDGRLPPYVARVVIDVNNWANEYFSNGIGLMDFSSGYIDERNRRIYIRHGAYPLENVLIHEMAHAATTGDPAPGVKKYSSTLPNQPLHNFVPRLSAFFDPNILVAKSRAVLVSESIAQRTP